jgi:epsilon-lactone hydrolase
MPSQEMQDTLSYLRSARQQAAPAADEAEALRTSRERAELLPTLYPTPGDVVVEHVDLDGLAADLLVPGGVSRDRGVLYLHGGAYVAYSSRTHRELAARIARAAGCVALVPDYRLAPEHPHPAAVEDAVAAYQWLSARGPVAVAGDSAGGGLALALALRLRGAGATPPRALALLSPWTDLTLSSDSVERVVDDVLLDVDRVRASARHYAAGTDLTDPELSPVHGDLRGLPPMHVEVGTAEILLDDSVRLADAARRAGVDVTLEVGQDLPHVFQAFATTPEARASTDRVGAFLRRHLS